MESGRRAGGAGHADFNEDTQPRASKNIEWHEHSGVNILPPGVIEGGGGVRGKSHANEKESTSR